MDVLVPDIQIKDDVETVLPNMKTAGQQPDIIPTVLLNNANDLSEDEIVEEANSKQDLDPFNKNEQDMSDTVSAQEVDRPRSTEDQDLGKDPSVEKKINGNEQHDDGKLQEISSLPIDFCKDESSKSDATFASETKRSLWTKMKRTQKIFKKKILHKKDSKNVNFEDHVKVEIKSEASELSKPSENIVPGENNEQPDVKKVEALENLTENKSEVTEVRTVSS